MHPTTHRRVVAVLTILLSLIGATTLTSCSADDELSIVCSNEEHICQRWVEQFTATSGVPAHFLRLPTSQALARISGSKSAPEFDVWVGGPSENYVAAMEAGLLDPYFPTGYSQIPRKFRSNSGHWFGVYGSVLALCSNPDVLERLGVTAPRSWRDLEAPTLNGWVSASSPLTSGTAYTALWTQIRVFGADADRHLRTVYSHASRLTHSGTSPADVTARGEAAVAISFAPYCRQKVASGRPMTIAYPSEGTSFEVGGAARIRRARHPDQARIFLDWLSEPAGQEVAAHDEQIHQRPITRSLPGNLAEVLDSTRIKVLYPDTGLAAHARQTWLTWFDHEIQGQP
ncbi:extracellular solute-binding protein [Cutibacterium avidum]|uniref:extracellular solute-binding protein n=1 Tax=Cutibacterium avidum TaxID=33010 RepID=UPI0009BF1A09|nr:extracellular solute-binding protein [Cutibacterium avidum]